MPGSPSTSAARARLDALGLARAGAGWVPTPDQGASPPAGPEAAASAAGPDPWRPGPGAAAQLGAALADRLPLWLRGARVAPGGSALVLLAAVCLAGLAVTAFGLLRHRSAPLPAVAQPPAVLQAPPSPSPLPQLVVDVGGRVRHPGLVTLTVGARVADALAAAGGPLRSADIATLDLAARVSDGQLLLVGVPGAPPAGSGPGGAVAPGPVNLNTASLEQLDTLPGVGPVLAQRIVSWRDAHGSFRSVEDLQQVPGIGDRTYADLRPLVTT